MPSGPTYVRDDGQIDTETEVRNLSKISRKDVVLRFHATPLRLEESHHL